MAVKFKISGPSFSKKESSLNQWIYKGIKFNVEKFKKNK